MRVPGVAVCVPAAQGAHQGWSLHGTWGAVIPKGVCGEERRVCPCVHTHTHMCVMSVCVVVCDTVRELHLWSISRCVSDQVPTSEDIFTGAS